MAKKETNKEVNKNKKSFFKDFKAELKKVSWPTVKQLANNTVAVIVIVVLTAVIVFALDFVFEAMNKHGIDRIKEVVSQSNVTSENTADEENSSENEEQEKGSEESDGKVEENTNSDESESKENTTEETSQN